MDFDCGKGIALAEYQVISSAPIETLLCVNKSNSFPTVIVEIYSETQLLLEE